MALAPQAAPAPTPTAAGGPAAADPMAPDMGEGGEPTVLATIIKNADGSLELREGDAPAAMEGEAPEPGEESEPAGQQFAFEDRGKLLTALNGMIEASNGGGAGPAQKAFESGYKGDEGAMPPKGM